MKKYNFFLLIIFCFFYTINICYAEEIKIEANYAQYNEKSSEFLISGEVKISFEKEYVTADNAIYHKTLDKLIAQGNVKYYDKDGNIYNTNQIELSNKFNIGKATKIKVNLKNQSIIFADSIIKNNGIETLSTATYTSCRTICKNSEPLWKINASEVVINREKNTVYYKNALFKVKNIPIFYTPIFYSYIKKRRSTGFLTPILIRNTNTGTSFKVPFYINIASNQDLVFSQIFSQHKNFIYEFEHRYLNTYGKMESNFSYKNKDKQEKAQNLNSKNYRGHLFLRANAHVKDLYNKIAINFVTDKNYLDDYNFFKNGYYINDTNILTSKIYLQKVNNINSYVFKTLYFQNLNFNKKLEDNTIVLPALTIRTFQEYLNGSKTKQMIDFASIYKRNEVNINRTSLELSYIYPYVTSSGILTSSNFILHSDIYSYQKKKPLLQKDFKNNMRNFPEVKFEASYPLISTFKKNDFIIAPLADISFKPRTNYNKDVLLEDSQFNDINFNNVFMSNKYSGFDIVESGTRYNYGLRLDYKTKSKRNINFLFGQSYYQHINSHKKLGKSKYSNLVGKINFNDKAFFINYTYILDNKKYSILQHTIFLSKDFKKYSFEAQYSANFDNIADVNNIANKKELIIKNRANIYQNIDLNFFAKFDLTKKKHNKAVNENFTNKLTKLGGAVTINHDCAKIDFSAEQDYTHLKSKPNNSYWIRIWLKNLV